MAPGLKLLLEDVNSRRLNEEAFVNHGYAKLGFQGGVPKRYRDGKLTQEERVFLGMAVGRALERLPHPVRQSIRNKLARADEREFARQEGPEAAAVAPLYDLPKEGCVNNDWFPGRGTFKCVHRTSSFLVYYNVDGTHNVDPYDGAGIAAQGDIASNGVPNYIDRTARSFEYALSGYRSLGYDWPNKGYKTVVFIGAEHQDPGTGFVPPNALTDVSEIWIGNQFSNGDEADEFYLPRHELFHIMQYSYLHLDDVTNINVVNMWMEATAEWGAHQILRNDMAAPHSSRIAYADSLGTFFDSPGRGLLAWDGFGGGRQYGAFIFAEYLDQRFGVDSVRRSWEHMGEGQASPSRALADTIRDYGSTTMEELRVFGLANYQMCGGTNSADHDGSWRYTDADVPAWCSAIGNIGHGPQFPAVPPPEAPDHRAAPRRQGQLGGLPARWIHGIHRSRRLW